ncbi:MAG: class I SAM-dependent methyltransferase [bacterium]|nr:class I SAM-dependent methyltransferase [bacterium]
MGLYNNQILPRRLAWGMGRRFFSDHRVRCLRGLSGRILEIGFGAGHNLEFYPVEVTEVLALEPSQLARKLSKHRVGTAAMPLSFVGLGGADIPLGDESVDGIAISPPAHGSFRVREAPGADIPLPGHRPAPKIVS